MSSSPNDLFKFISLRQPSDDYSIDPGNIVGGSIALKLLDGFEVNPVNPQPEVMTRLKAVTLLTEETLRGLALEQAATVVYSDGAATFDGLTQASIRVGNQSISLAAFAASPTFHDEYRRVFDSWLVLRLRGERGDLIQNHGRLLRTGFLIWTLATSPDALRDDSQISRLRSARLQLPAAWKSAPRRLQDVRARHSSVLPNLSNVANSDRTKRTQAIKQRHAQLGKLIAQHEAILTQIHKGYFALKRDQSIGLNQAKAKKPPIASPPVPLTDQFYANMDKRLDAAQKNVFNEAVSRVPGGRPVDLDDLIEAFEQGILVEEANALCKELHEIEYAEQECLPVAQPSTAFPQRPLISAIGLGELVVAREQLVGYTAREIAHIENVLSGESKVREHERINKTEQVTETETITEKETEKDSQTTDRYELQNQSQATIRQDFSIQAGINTSGRYGLTQVDTSLDTAFQQSKSESRSSSMNTAKEIVSRAVERTFERVRNLRRLTITEQIRELNRHRLANPNEAGKLAPPVSGIYLWVEKIYQVELRHYGTRAMIEFHIPEPALSLLERGSKSYRRRRLPPFDVSPQDITATNYLCLAQRHAAMDVEPPPTQYINVGFTWGSAPSEESESFAEDTISEMIAVPDGYRPISGTAIISPFKTSDEFDVYMAVGGMTVVNSTVSGSVDAHGLGIRELPFTESRVWSNGVPVSGRAHGHFDKTMVAQVALKCERTPEAMTKWQLRTWEQLRTGYEGLSRQLERDMQQEALTRNLFVNIAGRPESENRRVERQELAKWAIKTMRLKPHNFNAVEQVGDFQEVSPLDADMQAPIVRFFEEAFEWEHMSYFLFPYYWARRDSWAMRNNADAVDPRFRAFLNAGAARVIVPITPGYESKVLHYLNSDPEMDELARVSAPPPKEVIDVPLDTIFDDLWVELLTDRKADTALGSGTLKVEHGSDLVHINKDSSWDVSERDLGRELYIDGERYTVTAVMPKREFKLDRPFVGETKKKAIYATGSVPYGPPWLVNVPTSLVILDENRGRLDSLVS